MTTLEISVVSLNVSIPYSLDVSIPYSLAIPSLGIKLRKTPMHRGSYETERALHCYF